MSAPLTFRSREHVPVRTIATAIGMVLATVIVLAALLRVERVLVWLVVAAFLATALWPVVGLVERRARVPRSVACLLVFVVGAAVVSGVVALLVAPLVTQGREFVSNFPDYVAQAKSGRGPVGEVVARFHLDTYVARNESKIRESATHLGSSATHVLGYIASTLTAVLSIVVLTFLMLLEGPKLLGSGLNALGEPRRTRVERVGRDCARAVTGYMAGNLVISVICGLLTFVTLTLAHVPYAGVLAVFVALMDLIPLIGATLGAAVATAVAFLHSTTAGLVAVVFFVLYQQLENHLLQPLVLSRAVKLNPLVVLVSILLGVELAGILGTLLAIPVAGMVQVLVRDFYDTRRGTLKAQPTVGEDKRPVSEPYPDEEAARADVPAH